MLAVDEELKKMYRSSSIPKKLFIKFPKTELDNSRIFSFTMDESLSDDKDILFGSCQSAQIKARVSGVDKSIIGQRCEVYQIVNDTYTMPLGYYTIKSVSKKDDLGYREIVGYDDIHVKLDVDVTKWYQSLALPLPLKTFRQSLFAYVGIPIADQNLVNDDMVVERTIEPKTLDGRTVAAAIGEINGTFGHIGRDGIFKYISLGGIGLYPADDLFPSDDLFPAESDAVYSGSSMFTCTREEYEVTPIDCLQIRQEEGDVGQVVYDTRAYKNPYIVTGNFLVYGKTASQLEVIGRNMFNHIKGIPYTPFEAKTVGLPYLEVGDGITFTTKKDNFYSFVMKRSIDGIQSLRDTMSATGNQYRENKVSPNNEIEMLKGRALIIKKSVDGLSTHVTNLEQGTNSRFEQAADRITAEVNRATQAEGELSGRVQIAADSIAAEVKRATGAEDSLAAGIKINADSIALKISKGDYGSIVSAINLDANGVKIKGDKIEITGNAVFKSVQTDVDGLSTGETTINGGCIKTGLVEAERIDVENLVVQNIDCGSGYLKASKGNVLLGGLKVWGSGSSTYLGDAADGDNFGMGSGKGSHFWSNWVGSDEFNGNGSAIFQVDNYGRVYAQDVFLINLYGRTGDINVYNHMYIPDIYITGDDSFWQGWGLTRTMIDIYNRLEALEG